MSQQKGAYWLPVTCNATSMRPLCDRKSLPVAKFTERVFRDMRRVEMLFSNSDQSPSVFWTCILTSHNRFLRFQWSPVDR